MNLHISPIQNSDDLKQNKDNKMHKIFIFLEILYTKINYLSISNIPLFTILNLQQK